MLSFWLDSVGQTQFNPGQCYYKVWSPVLEYEPIAPSPTITLASPCEDANEYVVEAYYYPQRQQALLEDALRLCPSHAVANNNLGVLLEKQHQYAQALKHYQRAVKADYKSAWLGVGSVYYQQKQFPLSLEAYLQVCNEHQTARERVIELLRDQRYKTANEEVILNQQSLQLLYDKNRLQKLYQQAAECRNNFRGIAAQEESLRAILVPVAIFQAIHFKTGKHDLSLVSDTQLDEIARALSKVPGKMIKIKGHSDIQRFAGKSQLESDSLNLELSKNRAKSVKQALIERGITSTRINIYGYGASCPLVMGYDAVALSKNRRVEIEID
jgi:outer membrane protein OmpA-like peptidoglycan-associated protein